MLTKQQLLTEISVTLRTIASSPLNLKISDTVIYLSKRNKTVKSRSKRTFRRSRNHSLRKSKVLMSRSKPCLTSRIRKFSTWNKLRNTNSSAAKNKSLVLSSSLISITISLSPRSKDLNWNSKIWKTKRRASERADSVVCWLQILKLITLNL